MTLYQEQLFLLWIFKDKTMKNNKIIIFIIIFLLIISIILIRKCDKKSVNTYDFPNTINVINYTDNIRADTITMIITHMIMNYDTINIDIYHFINDLNINNYSIIGFIQKIDKPHTYQIFLDNVSQSKLITVLSHELIHLDQMEKGDLIYDLGNTEYVIYKNDTIFFNETPYKKRPHEIDAYSRQKNIEQQLRNLLYKK